MSQTDNKYTGGMSGGIMTAAPDTVKNTAPTKTYGKEDLVPPAPGRSDSVIFGVGNQNKI